MRRLYVFCCLTAALAGCGKGKRGLGECERSIKAGEYETAAVTCGKRHEQTGDPRAGARAAEALAHLGRHDEVLSWVSRLPESPAVAPAWYAAGKAYMARNDMDSARAAYRRSLDLFERGDDHVGAYRAAYTLFYWSWREGDYRGAFDYARTAFDRVQQALAHPESSLYDITRDDPTRAALAVATVLYELGNAEGALRMLQTVALSPEGPKTEMSARIENLEGSIQSDRGRKNLARDLGEKSLVSARAGGVSDPEFLRSAHLNLVSYNLSIGDVERARYHLDEAWKHMPESGPNSALRFFRARVARAQGDLDEAERALAAALDAEPILDWAWELEYERGVIAQARGHDEQAESAFRRAVDRVEELRRQLGLNEFKAWTLEQKRRPHEALFELLARAQRTREALEISERAKARTFLDAFVAATTDRASQESAGAAAIDLTDSSTVERADALRALLPAMLSSPVVATRSADELLDGLRSHHVLMYLQTREHVWAIILARGELRIARLDVSPDALSRAVTRFLRDVDDKQQAQALGQMLLPSGSLPQEDDGPVYIVTDGVLGRVPFAALRHGDRYLVERHAITYVPSASALLAIERRAWTANGPARVLGDPRGDLPAASAEARDVAERLRVPAWTGKQATAERLAQASGAPVLHLATHAGMGPRGPWLALAERDIDAAFVMSARLDSRLVVLASCASAARRGKGLWGSLGAAFLAVGSKSVLASLWSVDDAATRDLIVRFYDRDGAADPVRALARAQRELIASGQPASVWAPFVVLGSAEGR